MRFVHPFLPQETVLELPKITGQDLLDVAKAIKSTAGGPDGWAWNEIKSLPSAWFSGLTPLGQRPLGVLPVVFRLWASLGPSHLKDWVQDKVPQSGLSSVETWFSTALDIEEVLSGAGWDQLHVMVADVTKSFDTVDRSILDGASGRLGLPSLFRKVHCACHERVRLRFWLAAGLGEPWCRDGGIPQGCPPEHGLYCCPVCLLV